ncbi:AraC family transcriptional regulator [Domibacillus sp. A3M-37]|uniref:AraC family transcriptional regulator n=1 Tax=Domibacillus sp. A3M-37 TaxID=2962037 RepID=UPI0020B6B109|nr:AraC family transcriptional regulator [Domibacillus sp. A3M-37]MCP3763462.1 AraC family transcriptional regulator [Domibacillus sp. A3M-37]
MFSLLDDSHHSFVYHHAKEPLTEAARVVSIGFEKWTSTDYYWDGRMRKNDHNTYIFQYTLNGYGEVQAGEQTLSIRPGEAFIVKVPSDHCYYLPAESPEWEFLFITLEGTKAEECWDYLTGQFGLRMTVENTAPLIFLLKKIYQFAVKEGIKDFFTSSAYAYEFIMGLYRFAKGLDHVKTEIPEDIRTAIQFMTAHYHEPLSLDEIADHARLSKYYFTNKFQKHMKTTPIQFLTKMRMQKAMELLTTTNKTLHEIAMETGYDNSNYFSKVFKKMIGMSADSFRKDKKMMDLQHVIID